MNCQTFLSYDFQISPSLCTKWWIVNYIEYFANSSCCFRMDFTPLWMVRNLEARCIKQMGKWWQSMSTFLPCVRKRKKEEITEKTKETIDSFFVLYIKLDANPRDIHGAQRTKIAKKVLKPHYLNRVASFFWRRLKLWVLGWKREDM